MLPSGGGAAVERTRLRVGGFWCDFKWAGRVGVGGTNRGGRRKKVELGMELLEAAAVS